MYMETTYRIPENYRGKERSRFGTKREFRGENFCGFLRSNYYTHMQVRPQNFEEKTFMDGSETAKNAKAFCYMVLDLYIYIV